MEAKEVVDFVEKARAEGFPIELSESLGEGSIFWVRNQIAILEERGQLGKLSDIDQQYLVNLKATLAEGGKVPEHIYVENVLRQKLGPKYQEFVRRRGDHRKQLEELKKVNDELQKQVDLATATRGRPFEALADAAPLTTTETDETGFKTIVPNPMRQVLGTLDAVSRIEPGTYVVDVDVNHRVTSFKITSMPTLGFWARIRRWFRA